MYTLGIQTAKKKAKIMLTPWWHMPTNLNDNDTRPTQHTTRPRSQHLAQPAPRFPLPTSLPPPPLLTAHLPISLPNALAVVAIRKAQGEVFVHLGDKTTQERDKARVESVGKSALQNGSYVQSWRRLDNQSVFKNQMRITATKRSADKRLRQKIIPIIYI